MDADERVFRAHVARAAFQVGVDRGRWRSISIDWPVAVIAVSAASRAGASDEYAFQFKLNGYPTTAPTGRLWDAGGDQALAHARRPWGGGRVALAFRTDWRGDTCLYLPCDREALAGHDAWRTQHPSMIWNSSSDITLYLRVLHDLLHSRDYTGIRGT
ncbi:MAG: DUF7665 family protein [Gemmatimonadaceae bacterium]